MLNRFVILLFVSVWLPSFALASPEYLDWLAKGRVNPTESVALQLSDLIGEPVDHAEVVLPVRESLATLPIELAATAGTKRKDSFDREDFLAPILNQPNFPLSIRFFGLNITLSIPNRHADFWMSGDPMANQVTDAFVQDSKQVAFQLSRLAQHYDWNDWELLRVAELIAHQMNADIDIAVYQWCLMKALGYEVMLGEQQDKFYLMFSAKQQILDYAYIKFAGITYYLYPDSGSPLSPSVNSDPEVNPKNSLYGAALSTEQPMALFKLKDTQTGGRLNLLMPSLAFYGNGWTELMLSYGTGSLNLPVSVYRAQAMAQMPNLALKNLLDTEMPQHQAMILQEKVPLMVGKLKDSAKVDWLRAFVMLNFADQQQLDAQTAAYLLGVQPYKNMSFVRAYFLKQLIESAGLPLVAAIESEHNVWLVAIDESTDAKTNLMLNSKYYRAITFGSEDSDSILEQPFKTLILN